MRLLDLFCGRWGWSRAFAARGWECVGVDLAMPEEIPEGCRFLRLDVRSLYVHPGANCRGEIRWRGPQIVDWIKPDFICASSPCEEFSVHGMKHFHPNPKYPTEGIELFNHTRAICETSGVPYVMENVRAAQWFVGQAQCNAGAFHLWHNLGNFPLVFGRPFKLPRGISKGATQMRRDGSFRRRGGVDEAMYCAKDERAAQLATIPPELSACVAEYAERLLEGKAVQAVAGQ